MLLIRLSNSQFIHDSDFFEEEYINQALPGVKESIEEHEDYKNGTEKVSSASAYKHLQNQKLLETIKNFFHHAEILRKNYMENFVAPHETFKLPVLNSNEKILFSKDFIKRNLNIKKYDDLVLMNIDEDNMQGTFNKNDIALIVKFKNNMLPQKHEDGIYALNINEKISIRRLQFLKLPKRTLVTIISDNKNYSDQNVALEDLSIFGEVVWKCNSFKDIKFEKYIDNTPDLFSEDKTITNKLLEKETA
jgi:phage repressor protein C with HTH and peptisase S24 domain